MSRLQTLPPKVVRELCQHLNMEGAGVRNWRDLLTQVQDHPYDIFACDSFSRNGLRPYTSPAEEVIRDFVSRGISVDELYCMLAGMDAWGCMALLEDYVTSAVVLEMKRKREEKRSTYSLPLGSTAMTPPTDSSPSPEEHPEFGPLPSRPPVTPPEPAQPPAPPIWEQTPSASTWSQSSSGDQSTSTYYSGGQSTLAPSVPPFPPHQQFHQPSEGYHNVGTSTDTTHPFPYDGHAHFNVQPHPLPSSTTYSSSCSSGDSSVFAHNTASETTDTRFSPSSNSASSGSVGSESSGGGSMNILHFSYTELSEATGGFTEGMVGIGAFGTVFRAKIRGSGPYAVKKLHTEAEMGVHCGQFYETFHRESFAQELQLLTRYHHRNILSLVAHSNDGYCPCLVYEYMENGSLAECLQGKRGVRLSWQLRHSIAMQVAEALHFLHTVNNPTCLVHGDIKSANILLDVHFVPKLSDFGLARECRSKGNARSISTTTQSHVVMGTLAYMAPEFLRNKKLTTRTDVYAFGVVMLELYTGQPAFSADTAHKDRLLTDRLSDLLEDSELHRGEVMMAADRHANWPQETALVLFDIITVCLKSKQKLRLSIRQVLDQLLILPQ